jgi:hypothetical protein
MGFKCSKIVSPGGIYQKIYEAGGGCLSRRAKMQPVESGAGSPIDLYRITCGTRQTFLTDRKRANQ